MSSAFSIDDRDDHPSVADVRLQRLSAVIAELAGARTFADLNTVVVTQAAEAMEAEVVSLSVLSDDEQTLRLLGVTGAQPGAQSEWSAYPVSTDVPAGEAVLTRAPVMVTGPELQLRYPALAEYARPGRTLLCLPLLGGTRCLGAISLSFERSAPPDDREMDFLATLANACAHAVERLRAQQDAEVRARKLEFLARASAELASSMDYRTTLAKVARLAVPTLADWCGVRILEDGTLRSLAVAHVDPAKVALAEEMERRYPPDPDGATGPFHVVRTGASELYPEISDDMLVAAAQDEDHLALCRELQLRSALTVPLVARSRILGVLTMVWAESGHQYNAEDLALAEDVARRAAVAIDNAALHTQTLEAALRLQRALLPDTPPQLPGYDIAAEYRAAGHTDVGGDFYDVLRLPSGRIAVVVGDVMGRGVAAAAAMAQVRAAVRAYVAIDPDPVAVTTHLDALFADPGMFAARDTPHLVTMVYLLADGRRITLCNAGHPPPLRLDPRGGATLLPLADSVPLGVHPESRTARQFELVEGETLLVYTDGLIERRREDIDVGLDRLLAAAADLCRTDLRRGLHDLVATMHDPGRDDDVTALALRPQPGHSGAATI